MKIYIASKSIHRPYWRAFRDLGHNIISRWIDVEDKYTIDPTGLDFKELWEWCIKDVQECDVLVCYVEPGEVLKGALIEVGVALGLGKRVVCVGSIQDYLNNGTWLNHPRVEHCPGFQFSGLMEELRGEESRNTIAAADTEKAKSRGRRKVV